MGILIGLEHVAHEWPNKKVLDDLTIGVHEGERIGVVGKNGDGKSTLLKLMTGRLKPTKGSVGIGASVKFGWMSQHLDALSDKEDWRILEILSRYKHSYLVGGKMLSPTQLCERLGFEQRELQSFVSDLSGGQRRRLALLCVILDEPNVLVLDEPGNDLDTDMLAVLEDLLDSWPGTLLVVSHDRYLVERVTDDQFALIDGHVRHVPGGVDEYLRLASEAEASAASSQCDAADASAQAKKPQAEGLSNAERRELKKRYDAVSRKLEKLEGELDRLRAAMAGIDPSNYAELMDAQAKVDECLAQKDALEEEWLDLADKLGL